MEDGRNEEGGKKSPLRALFTDKDWDWDLSKTVGAICIVCGGVGFFLDKGGFLGMLGFGAGLLGISKMQGD